MQAFDAHATLWLSFALRLNPDGHGPLHTLLVTRTIEALLAAERRGAGECARATGAALRAEEAAPPATASKGKSKAKGKGKAWAHDGPASALSPRAAAATFCHRPRRRPRTPQTIATDYKWEIYFVTPLVGYVRVRKSKTAKLRALGGPMRKMAQGNFTHRLHLSC